MPPKPPKAPATADPKEPGFGPAIVALSAEVKKLRKGISSFEAVIRRLQKEALKAAKKKADS